MDTEKVYTTSLRLYKNRPVHHQAYRYLKEYNKDIFKTKDDFNSRSNRLFCQVSTAGRRSTADETIKYPSGKPERTIL